MYRIKEVIMNTQKFNNETEFNEWVKKYLTYQGVIGREVDAPYNYPCIMVYEFISHPFCDCSCDEEEFDELIEMGYESDEIEKFIYHFVDMTHFE